jgi:subtilisin family serine protease
MTINSPLRTSDVTQGPSQPRRARIWLVLLAFAGLLPGLAIGQPPSGAARFQKPDGPSRFVPAALPPALQGGDRVTVVVNMSIEAVAVVRAHSPGHAVSEDQHRAIEAGIHAQHASIEPQIIARGGKVLAHMHDALNGIKIEVARSELASIAALPGVVAVRPVARYHLSNAVSVPFIGAPAVWQGVPGFRGESIKIAIIDTGIDYTHANFGGPGTVAAFQVAAAASTLPADPALFGPDAPKVKGGTDLVGDDYNADIAGSLPVPDPNPLDCGGHGSHVAGTAAGFGVTAAGLTYAGPYDNAAYQQAFGIGPGVAPKAELFAVRVFGCAGSTNVVTEAIDWAVHHGMDVISMSLGSDFGAADTSDALAAANATQAGIIVAAASGNAGPAPYIASTPASGDGVLSVAAMDSTPAFAGASVQLDSGASLEMIDANGASIASAPLAVIVLRDAAGAVSLGCNEAEYVDAQISGKLVVTQRGTCARVLRAQLGQRHGAAAVAMINNGSGYPPFEGTIAGVTIPFLGALTSDSAALTASTNVALLANQLPNPGYRRVAGFSSGGPRFGDSDFKPNLTAPGVSIRSTLSGSGTDSVVESGTSMATPHVAGVAALTRQAHPTWDERALAAAMAETAAPAGLLDYDPRLEGTGLVQPLGATRTQAVVLGGEGAPAATAFSFGYAEGTQDFRATRTLSVVNYGDAPIRFRVSVTPSAGVAHTLTLERRSLTVAAGRSEDLTASLVVPVAAVGPAHDGAGNAVYDAAAGYVTLTPADPAMNGGVSLHVPYYFVPRARANAQFQLAAKFGPAHPSATLRVSNPGGAVDAALDFYAWGLSSPPQGIPYFDIRAVGVQSNPISASDSVLVFAVNTHQRFSAFGYGEFDILIDVNGDGVPDFLLFAFDYGYLSAGVFNGQVASALLDLKSGAVTVNFLADAATDQSTVLLPVFASDLGVTPTHPRFSYSAASYFPNGAPAPLPGTASFNAFAPSITNAIYPPSIPPNGTATVPVSLDPVEWATTPALGLMVVTQDNRAGAAQARLFRVGH